MSGVEATARYPVQLTVHNPEQQSRWRTLLRLPLSIPVLVFSLALQGGGVLATWMAILVSGRIPRWLFDFQVAVNRWQLRAGAYFLLLSDEYPPFEGDYGIQYSVEYPHGLSRWRLVVWKFVTSVPHALALAVLAATLVVVVPIGWFAILFTGRFPEGFHGHVAGILRWEARLQAYVLSLTDEFPPFSLSADAGAGGRNSYVFSSAVGVLAVGSAVGLFAALVILTPGDVRTDVSYERLLAGELQPGETRVQVDSAEEQFETSPRTGSVELTGAVDRVEETIPRLVPQPAYRLVQFELVIENEDYTVLEIRTSDFRLVGEDGSRQKALVVAVAGRVPPLDVSQGESAPSTILFELAEDVDPGELHFNMGHHVHRSVIYRFH